LISALEKRKKLTNLLEFQYKKTFPSSWQFCRWNTHLEYLKALDTLLLPLGASEEKENSHIEK